MYGRSMSSVQMNRFYAIFLNSSGTQTLHFLQSVKYAHCLLNIHNVVLHEICDRLHCLCVCVAHSMNFLQQTDLQNRKFRRFSNQFLPGK